MSLSEAPAQETVLVAVKPRPLRQRRFLRLRLASFFHRALTRRTLPQQTQIPDYAELIVKFLEALIDSYLPAADEERGEEQLRTPTSPYPPTSQSQLSITANLNLSNSMTSLATSQHSPGDFLFLH